MSWLGNKSVRRLIASVAVASVVGQPQLLMAGELSAVNSRTAQARPMQMISAAPRDVVLGEGGVLVGQVVDSKGAAIPLALVSLRTGGKEIARLQSDQDGNFRVASLKGGVYQIVSVGNEGTYRLWSPRTAPPAAIKSLTVVARGDVVRGQYATGGNTFRRVGQMMAEHPLITAGIVAAGIAIPIALDDDDDPSSP